MRSTSVVQSPVAYANSERRLMAAYQAERTLGVTVKHHLFLPGNIERYADVADGITVANDAFETALDVMQEAGGGDVVFNGAGPYLFDALVQRSNYSNIRIIGCNSEIRARLAQTENVWTFLDCDGIEIDGFRFDGGYSVTMFSNQVLSFRDPVNCTVRNCRFTDFFNSAVLMFSADRNSDGSATNNRMDHLWCDGTGVARAGFLMESMDASYMVHLTAVNVLAADLGYAIEFKNHCTNSIMAFCVAVNSRWGIIVLDDNNPGTPDGAGAENCIVRGCIAKACINGFASNYSGDCSFEVDVDMEGAAETGGIAYTIAAHCLDNTHYVSIRGCDPADTCITTRSDNQTIFLRDWDTAGAVLWNIDVAVERNRLVLFNLFNNSTTFDPASLIVNGSTAAGASANHFQDLRNFMYQEVGSTTASLFFPVPGKSRSTHAARMADGQFAVRTNGVDRVQFNETNSGWYPTADNTYDSGITSQRWRASYAEKVFAGPASSGQFWTSGAGTPEGVVTAPVGSLYTRSDGGATTTLYVKTSGSGNTGWTAK